MKNYSVSCGKYTLELGNSPAIMGILNVTPDSFSDGGKYTQCDTAFRHALRMVKDGASIIDVGGESTRPFADNVTPEEEANRVLPVIKKLAETVSVPISIDTMKACVAQKAIEAGASIINDVSAMCFDSEMVNVAVKYNVPVILMHMRGIPGTMQISPDYENVVKDVKKFLGKAIQKAVDSGISMDKIIIDPGIGFGKTVKHNLLLIKELKTFQTLGVPILMGTSRKSFIRTIIKNHVESETITPFQIEIGTQATVATSILNGADIVRVHDVANTFNTVKIINAINSVH